MEHYVYFLKRACSLCLYQIAVHVGVCYHVALQRIVVQTDNVTSNEGCSNFITNSQHTVFFFFFFFKPC